MPMPSLKEFRQLLQTESVDELTERVVLADDAVHVSLPDRDYLKERIQDSFGLASDELKVIVVGSAKLGFSLVEKDRPVFKPRYRSFEGDSDVDIAVVSQKLYFSVWRELSDYSHSQPYFPWRAEKLSDYMLVGWIRPDKTPRDRPIRAVDEWWRLFGGFSNMTRFGRRRVRGGLYYARSFLHSYHRRAVAECAVLESGE